MQLGAVTFANIEGAGGIDRGSANTEYLEYSVSQSLGMMVLDCFLYLVLGLYFNQIVPTDTGVHKPWYFCCSPRWCCPSSTPINDADTSPVPSGGFIEASPTSLRAGVRIRGLRKEFPPASSGAQKLVAVDNLNLDLYEGQILSLLGHNGAGKTTTISMLTGLTAPTGGDATINGLSLRNSLEIIRPQLGTA
jgi:ATP-binding cassette subfamily A (ABC1) protein 3